MSCEDCRKAQETDEVIYYRLDNANLAIQCCSKHFRMLRARLQGQNKPSKLETTVFLKYEFGLGLFVGAAAALFVVGILLWLVG